MQLNIWLGRPEYCNFWAPPVCKLTLPIKGPSLLRITLPFPDLKPEFSLKCGHTSAATAAKNLLSGEIIGIHTFWSLINNELCMSTFPNWNCFRCCARNSHCSVFPQYISKQQHLIPALLPLLVILKRCFFQWIYFRKTLTSLWRLITLLVRMPRTRYLYIRKGMDLL